MHHDAGLDLARVITKILEVSFWVDDLVPVHRREKNFRLCLQLPNDLSIIIRAMPVEDAELEDSLTFERTGEIGEQRCLRARVHVDAALDLELRRLHAEGDGRQDEDA